MKTLDTPPERVTVSTGHLHSGRIALASFVTQFSSVFPVSGTEGSKSSARIPHCLLQRSLNGNTRTKTNLLFRNRVCLLFISWFKMACLFSFISYVKMFACIYVLYQVPAWCQDRLQMAMSHQVDAGDLHSPLQVQQVLLIDESSLQLHDP